MAKIILFLLVALSNIGVVVKVNMYDHSILVQIPGDYNRFKIWNDKKKEKDGDK